MVVTGMKQNSINKILIALFVLIVSYSIYNDKLKNSIKEEKKEITKQISDKFELIEDNYFYKLYKNDNKYKYIIYSKEKKVLAQEIVENYTYIVKNDDYIEVKINYGSKHILSKIYDIEEEKEILEKQNICLYNDEYVVVCNNDNIEVQDINNRDNYYKKFDIDKDIIANYFDINFKDKNKKIEIKYIKNKEIKKYSIKL